MSERERIKQVIDRLPEYKLAYVSNLILSIEKTDIEEAEPDEYNDCGSKKYNDGSVATLEELLEKE